MSRLGRRLALALVLVIGLLAAGVWAVQHWVGSDDFRARVASRAGTALGVELKLGRVEVDWWPVPALALVEVDVQTRPHLTITRLEARPAGAGLLAGRLELATLRSERARVERLANLGRVASSAAHDFNNVLTAILGYADLLELELPGVAVGQRELDEIRASVERGAVLVEEVLAFGRTRCSDKSEDESEIDLAQTLARLDGMARRVAGDGIVVSQRVELGLPLVRLDRERLERVVLNLVANARHAIEACPGRSGRIEISLERICGVLSARGSETLRLRVVDNGCGMRADVARRIFEPFFTTRGQLGGTGLGLADAADFAREAGGRIDVETTPGAGSAIQLDLPNSVSPTASLAPLASLG